MTTPSEAKEAILAAFIAVWDDSAPYTFDNEDYRPDGTVQAWARAAVRHEGGAQETLGQAGNRKFARYGRVLVQIFQAENTGTELADGLAVVVRDAFEGVTLDGTTVRFAGVDVREVGSSTKDRWYQVLVDAPFEYTETR